MPDLSQTLQQALEGGGFVMPPLCAVTVVLWYALGSRLQTLGRGVLRDADARVRGAPRGPEPAVRSWLDVHLADLIESTHRHAILVRSLVVLAPLLGLLGTVAGMIETFEGLAAMELFSQSGGVAGGVAQALLTTQVGLVIAIPGLLIGRALDRRERHVLEEIERIKDRVAADRGAS